MALSNERVHRGNETEHPHERAGIDFILKHLPDVDPYQAWELQEFVDPGTGRLYEVDLLVLGRHSLYVIEIKSHPGVVTGDMRDWRITHGGRSIQLQNPLFLTNAKARVLATRLKKVLPYNQRVWVQALVFLANDEVQIRLDESGRPHVVDQRRDKVVRAITHGEFPGTTVRHHRIVNRPTMKAVARALHDMGLRPSEARRRVGQYQLGRLLDEGQGFQEHLGQHASLKGKTCRVRSYLVPRATSAEQRSRLQRAAQREAEVLLRIGEHPGILRCREYVDQAPLGPALLFEPFEDGLPLAVFLRRTPDLSFDDRLEIIEKVSEALHHCHGKEVRHRNLSPATVLVRKQPEQPVEVRLHSFQLAWHEETSLGTRHLTGLAEQVGLLYQAPEVLDDPTRATVESDLFSLGALACFVLTGRHPADTPGAMEKLLWKNGSLQVSGIRDDLSPEIDEVIGFATALNPVNRPDDAIEWLALLQEVATRPEPAEGTVNPLEAKKGDELEGGLLVEKVLGSGATARVLQVQAGEKHYALKVPHDESNAERLSAEAKILGRLDHHHIVRSYGMRTVGDKDCLLLDLACPLTDEEGPGNLGELLRQEGSVGLDYARRFGDDLLSALQHLEDEKVQHRDIKPGNIGFTPDPKKKRHLVLFDFSLSTLDERQIAAGTVGYRDPFLRQRGRWDVAADLYSAAVTLYEILTGARPIKDTDLSAQEEAPRLRLQVERFDASLRDRLTDFFNRAFAPGAEERFETAEEMKTYWLGLFAALVPVKAPPAPPKPRAEVTTKTQVEALGLSSRARNALDRAGVVTVADLLGLPRNQLSAVRGVGRNVAQEIHLVAEQLRSTLTDLGTGEQAFAPAYEGARLLLRAGAPLDLNLDLDPETISALRDAGISTTTDLAQAAQARIEHLVGEGLASALRDRLLALGTGTGTGMGTGTGGDEVPWTISRWVESLLGPPSRKKPSRLDRQIACLLGLAPLPGATDVDLPLQDVTRVAEAFKVSRQAVHANLHRVRERWVQCPGLTELVDACTGIVEALWGVTTLQHAADELVRQHGGPAADKESRQAVALLRLVTELRLPPEETAPLQLARIHDIGWLGRGPEGLGVIRELGDAARKLALQEALPSSETVRSTLCGVVEGTSLSTVVPERLVSLAAAASGIAAVSTRLELYPRGMDAQRALELSSTALALPEVSAKVVQQRVRARYPEAEALPDRPELDRLLEPLGLTFSEAGGVYKRPGSELASISSTIMMPTRLTTGPAHLPRLATPEAVEAQDFDENLRASLERGLFRVLQVPSDLAERVAVLLGQELGIEPTSLDHLLWEHLEACREEHGVSSDAVMVADREGDGGKRWERLQRLTREAAQRVIEEVLARRGGKKQLLVHPGALARYDLRNELRELIRRTEEEPGESVLLLLPGHGEGLAAPSINNELAVETLKWQSLRVPRSWLANKHRAAAGMGGGISA
jgi:serine/threonine protein kinase